MRACTLPLTDVEKVLVIDGDVDARGAYHVASVLNPGSQVRIGAVPDVQPVSFLRSITLQTLSTYRAVYLIDVPDIGENAADALSQYVRRGGGLAWFLGPNINRDSYNSALLAQDRFLLPAPLGAVSDLPQAGANESADMQFGDASSLLAPLRAGGDGALALVGVAKSWDLQSRPLNEEPAADEPRVRTVLQRRDEKPLVTQHEVGRGRVITTLMGLDGRWTNWPGDPTFVVFMLQSNAWLWSGASPATRRFIDEPLERSLPVEAYAGQATFLPATDEPPRTPIELVAERIEPQSVGDEAIYRFKLDPSEMVIAGADNVDEMLHPGIAEWGLTRADGSGQVLPDAAVIHVGEGDLSRADPASITQQLLPLDVKFVSSSVWSEENRTAGSSTLTLLLLGLLGTVLAGEQLLAYWASYHVASDRAEVTRSHAASGGIYR